MTSGFFLANNLRRIFYMFIKGYTKIKKENNMMTKKYLPVLVTGFIMFRSGLMPEESYASVLLESLSVV